MVQQKDRYKEKVGGRPAKLNEKKKKQRRHYSSWNCSGGDKMRNASGHQSKENTYDISSRKRVTKKFLEVSLFIVVQNNGKEMYKKSVLQVQSCFFAN